MGLTEGEGEAPWLLANELACSIESLAFPWLLAPERDHGIEVEDGVPLALPTGQEHDGWNNSRHGSQHGVDSVLSNDFRNDLGEFRSRGDHVGLQQGSLDEHMEYCTFLQDIDGGVTIRGLLIESFHERNHSTKARESPGSGKEEFTEGTPLSPDIFNVDAGQHHADGASQFISIDNTLSRGPEEISIGDELIYINPKIPCTLTNYMNRLSNNHQS